MEYILEYMPSDYWKRERVRKTCLAFDVFFDLLALGLIFTAIIEPLVWIAVVGLVVLSITSRVIVNLYPTKYRYGVKRGAFIVLHITPLRTETILSCPLNDIREIVRYDSLGKNTLNTQNTVMLCDNSCMNYAYVLKLDDKSVIASLDEYMYTLLVSAIKRGNDDILR